MPEGPDVLTSKLKLTNIRFQSLGVVDFADNEQSDYKARELKSISMSTATLLLKMTINGCYKNILNVFSQTGIIAINCLGEVFALPNILPVQDKDGGRFEDEMQFDPSVINKLKALYVAKETAVKNQEFEEAITIKNAINRMKQYGILLNQLEEKRKKYMTKKKYEMASETRKEIKLLREFIANPNKIFNQETIFQKVGDAILKNMWGGKAEFFSSMLPENSELLKNTPLRGLNLVPLTTDLILKPGIEKYTLPKNGEEFVLKDEDERKRIEAMNREYLEAGMLKKPTPVKKVDFDDQAIPTIMNNREKDEEYKFLEDEENSKRYNLEAQDLDKETMELAKPIIDVFGLDIIKKLFSLDWHLREEAIRDVEREVKLGTKSALCGHLSNEEVFSAAMSVVSHGISDKISQVIYASYELCGTILSTLFPSITSLTKKEVTVDINNTVMWLLDKVGDTNTRIK